MNHSDRTIRIVFFVAIASLLSFSVILFLNFQKLTDAYSRIAHLKEVESNVQWAYSSIKTAESCVWAYVSSEEYAFLREKRNIESKLPQVLTDLRAMVKDDPKQVYNMQQFEFLINQRLQNLNTTLDSHAQRKTKKQRKPKISLGLPVMQQLEVLTSNIQQETSNQLAQTEQTKNRYVWLVPVYLILLSIILLLLLIFIFNFLRNKYRALTMTQSQMQDSTMQVDPLQREPAYNNEQPEMLNNKVAHNHQGRLRKLWTFTSTINQSESTTTQEDHTTLQEESTIPQQKNSVPADENIIPVEESFIPQEESIILPEVSNTPQVESKIHQEDSSISQVETTANPDELVGHLAEAAPGFEQPQQVEKGTQDMVDDLLAYNRLSAAKEMFEEVRLENVVEQVKENLRDMITETGTVIETNNMPVVRSIPAQMYLLFQNLLNNAIKFRRNDVTNKIVITGADVHFSALPDMSAANHRYYHRIVVTDNGIGFPQEHAQQVFEIFARLHRDQEFTGNGVGLTICKKVVENHDGLIYAESTPGAGTSFTIYLPNEK